MSKSHEVYPVTRGTIWNFRQNNPRLILDDARKYLDLDDQGIEMLKQILLARGVNKWFKVRRDLIAYKKQVKHQLKALEALRLTKKGTTEFRYLRTTARILMGVRRDLRRMCMTERWQMWPELGSHHKELRAMNTIRASD